MGAAIRRFSPEPCIPVNPQKVPGLSRCVIFGLVSNVTPHSVLIALAIPQPAVYRAGRSGGEQFIYLGYADALQPRLNLKRCHLDQIAMEWYLTETVCPFLSGKLAALRFRGELHARGHLMAAALAGARFADRLLLGEQNSEE